MLAAGKKRRDAFGALFRRGWIIQEAMQYEIGQLEWLCLVGRPRAERLEQDRKVALLAAKHQAILTELKMVTDTIRGRN